MPGMGMGMGMPGMGMGMGMPGMSPFGMQMPFNMQMPFGGMPGMQGMPMMNNGMNGMMQPMGQMQMPFQQMQPQMNPTQPQGMGMPGQPQSTASNMGMPGMPSGADSPQRITRDPSKDPSMYASEAGPDFLQAPGSSPAHLARLMSKESGLGGGISPVKEGGKEPPPLPPPLADGTRQVLVTIPRPLTASSDVPDDTSVKIPEFGVTIDLPNWYKEAQEELSKPGPSWPPQVVIDVGDLTEEGREPSSSSFLGRRASKASAETKTSSGIEVEVEDSGAGKLQAAMLARRRAMAEGEEEEEEKVSINKRSKFFPYIVAILFSQYVYKNGLKTIREWASKMQTHFEDTCQMQMRNCISWLSRALRTFARTLTMDSHAGLDLAPSRAGSFKILDLGSDLTARQRLAIRAYVLFDVLLTGIEVPPQPLTRFLSRLAQPEGIMMYVPKTYFTDSERAELKYDARGGIYSQPQSRQHQQLVAGFLIPRALLGGLFASWARTLENDASVGAERGKRNIQTLGALIYLGFQKKYELISTVHDIPGLSSATSDRLTQFGLDKRLVFEVGELVEKLVVFFTQPDAQVSMVERVQSNPFVAGNITIAPRDRQGEGAEPAVTTDDTPTLAPTTQRKTIVDRIRSITPAFSEQPSSAQRGGRFRQSVVAGRTKMALETGERKEEAKDEEESD